MPDRVRLRFNFHEKEFQMSINKIQKMLEKLLVAADNHGEDDDPDHTVGDLQGLLDS